MVSALHVDNDPDTLVTLPPRINLNSPSLLTVVECESESLWQLELVAVITTGKIGA
jgi:hypothetical protein